MVYTREAHPKNGWKIKGMSRIRDPRTISQRQRAAGRCTSDFGFDFPTLVDDMLDSTAVRYAAWPERIFVVNPDGRIGFAGGCGPSNFLVRRAPGVSDASGTDLSLEAYLQSI